MVAERTVVLLREQAAAAGVPLKILPAMSFLDLAYVDLGIDPIAGLRMLMPMILMRWQMRVNIR